MNNDVDIIFRCFFYTSQNKNTALLLSGNAVLLFCFEKQ